MRPFLAIISACFLLTACSSTGSDPANDDIIGTWRIDSDAHATWLGSQGQPTMGKTFMRVEADSTAADTTWFVSNDSLQIEITNNTGRYPGDFEFKFRIEGLDGNELYDKKFKSIVAASLNSAFDVAGYGGTSFEYDPDVSYFRIQTNFNCQSTDDTTQDLLIAFTAYSKNNVPDTLFYYQLDTNGMYQTVRHIACR